MRTRRIIALFGIAMIGAGVVVWRVLSGRGQRSIAGPSPSTPNWVEAIDGSCPASHPVKAKEGSGIYHLPGSSVYARTRPDRCYVDAAAAEADGYRAAKSAAARSTA
jgi:hypothetical protein